MSLTNFNPRILSRYVQATLDEALIGRTIANSRLESSLTSGNTVDIARLEDLTTTTYNDAVGVSGIIPSPGLDTLVVNFHETVTIDIPKVDKIQNLHNATALYGKQAMTALKNALDKHVLKETQNAATVNAFGAVTNSNVIDLFFQAEEGLRLENVTTDNLISVISPKEYRFLQTMRATNGFKAADKVLTNGFVGTMGSFDIFVSNNLTTDATDRYLYFGKRGAVELVVQDEIGIVEVPRIATGGKNLLGKRYIADTLAGVKTTTQGAKMLYTQKVTK